MATRNEWTEWHLTPEGWQRGSTRVQGRGNLWLDEPPDRVLSFMYKEVQPEGAPEATVTVEETWRSKTGGGEMNALLQQHGQSPRLL